MSENQVLEYRPTFLGDSRPMHLPESVFDETRAPMGKKRSCSMGDQAEKFHPQGVKRLYLAIVNRAILDVLKNGEDSLGAERWLLSRDFDGLQQLFGSGDAPWR